MRNKNINRIIFAAVCILFSNGLFAQHNEQVVIEGSYRPHINTVEKIRLKPEQRSSTFSAPEMPITVRDFDYNFKIETEALSPMAYSNKNENANVTENFLMAGFGTRISPIFNYHHNSKLNKNTGIGVGVTHFSSWLNIKDYAPSSFMNNDFNIELSNKLSEYQLHSQVFYKNDMYHYYGYDLNQHLIPEDEIDFYCPKQTYNTIGFGSMLSSTETSLNTIRHQVGIDYQYTFDKFDAKEHLATISGKLDYSNNWWGDRNKPQNIGANLKMTFMNYGIDSVRHNYFQFTAAPHFDMKDDFYKLQIGFRLDFLDSGNSKFAVRPDLTGSLYVFDKKVEFYAGLNGGLQLYKYSSFIEENPFLQSFLPISYQNVKIAFEGGLRTNILDRADIHFGVRYRKTDNEAFFMPAFTPIIQNKYNIVYDNVNILNLLFNVRWSILDNLGMEAAFAYNDYKTNEQAFAWYRPAVEASLKVNYLYDEKLSFNMTGLFNGKRHACQIDEDGQTLPIELSNIFDLGIGADFVVNKQLTVFLKVDNLLNQQYELFYNYPVAGLQAFAGIKMKF